jgi:1-acyl-sn-glycerol-3-phosphate acyltransferase
MERDGRTWTGDEMSGRTRGKLRPNLATRAFFVWAMLWATLMTIVSALGYVSSEFVLRRRSVFRKWSMFWARSMMAGTGIRLKYHRTERLDCSRSYVFVANHQIGLDIPLIALAVACPFGFVAKAELARIPFLGQAISYSPSVFVDRSNPRGTYESMRKAGENIRNGTSVIIFPEGARSYRREMGPFQKGAFLLALEAGVPIVPVTIIDAYEVVNEEKRMARPGVVHVVVGAPIPLEGMTRRDLPEVMETVRSAIERPLLQAAGDQRPNA